MTLQIGICLAIFILLIVLYITRKIPMGVSAILCLVLLVLTNCVDAKTALGNFAKTNTIMLFGMFVVAEGLSRTQMINKIATLVNRIGGGSFTKVLISFIAIDVLLAQVLPSGITRFTMLYPLLLAMCEAMDVSPKKAIYPLAFTNISCAAIVPLGHGATDYVKLNGYLESFGITDVSFNFFDPFIARIPILIIAPLLSVFVLPKLAGAASSHAAAAVDQPVKKKPQKEPLKPFQEFCGYAIFILVMLGMVTARYTKLDLSIITMAGAVLEIILGVLDSKDAIKSFPIRVICMYVGGLTLSNALVDTGTGALLGNAVVSLLNGTHSSFVIIAVIALISFVLAQLISNSSAEAIMNPLILATCVALGCNPIAPLLVAKTVILMGCMTPMSNVALPIVMGVTGQDFKEIFKQSLPVLLMVAVSIIYIPLVFPLW